MPSPYYTPALPAPSFNLAGGTVQNGNISQYIPEIPRSPSSSSFTNLNPSVVLAILVLSIITILSASLCLLLRCLNGRRHRRSRANDNRTASRVVLADRVNVAARERNVSRRVSPDNRSVLDALPLFTFDSVTGPTAIDAADCAVCLSRFQPSDQLRLLPICCHAFHAECIDTWLRSNQSCPLCRSPIFASESELLQKVMASSSTSESFRIQIGNVNQRIETSDSGEFQRSYSIGSFNYVARDESAVSVQSTHLRQFSREEKSDVGVLRSGTMPRGPDIAVAETAGDGRSWLRDYVDRLSRTSSIRSSGRFFAGSCRRSNDAVEPGEYELETSRAGEEISELFRWFSGEN